MSGAEGNESAGITDRAEAMLDDIRGTPAMLEAIAGGYDRPGGPLAALPGDLATRRIVLTGLGSSQYAALDAATHLRGTGVAAWAELPTAEPATPPGRDVVLVAISASGGTPETVAAAARHRGRSLVVAVTNDPGSALAREADVVLPLLAGVERSGVSCRSHPATSAVLALLAAATAPAAAPAAAAPAARRGAGDRIRRAAADRSTLLDRHAEWSGPATDLLDGAHAIGVVAGAATIGLAGQAALMLREAPRLPAAAHEAADWLHTAIYTALPGYRAVLLGDTPYADELHRTISRRGGAIVSVGARGSANVAIDAPADPLVLGVVADTLAAALWKRAGGVHAR